MRQTEDWLPWEHSAGKARSMVEGSELNMSQQCVLAAQSWSVSAGAQSMYQGNRLAPSSQHSSDLIWSNASIQIQERCS